MTVPNGCPDVNGFGRRVLLFAGLTIIFAALAVAAFVSGVTKWVPIAFALIGGALIPNAKIADVINSYVKSRSGNATSAP